MTDPAGSQSVPSTTRALAMAIHLSGIPLLFLPSMLAYLTVRDRSGFLARHARAALNFQLAVLAGLLIGFFTLWIGIGFYLVPAVALANAVFSCLAAADARRGEGARYLVSLPIVD